MLINERVMPEHTAEPTTVGSRIKLVRTKLGLTLEQLADRSKISKSFLWEVEQGSDISGERLLRVANALNASLDFLLRGEPAPSDYKPTSVEIPSEVHELAQEMGLSYRQTMALLQVDRSIVTHRRDARVGRDKDYWRRLYESVKPFLENES